MSFEIDKIDAKKTGKKPSYDLEQVKKSAMAMQHAAFNNIGNMLNGTMRPDTSQVGHSASNL